MLKEYRKTAIIKAEQFDETAEAILKYHAIPKARFISAPNDESPWLLPTKEGYMSLKKGDWIATGVESEHWVIADDIFKKTYERVEGGMILTERQKNCPYCHVGSDIKAENGSTAWNDGELCFDRIESDPNIQNDGLIYADMDFNPKLHTLTVWGNGVDPLIVYIAYCPMCGRKLEDDL